MNSENQQAQPNTQAASAATSRPTVREIIPTLKDADDPLAFIQANLQAQQPVVDPNAVVQQVEEKRAADAKAQASAAVSDIPLPEINLTEKEKEDALRKETQSVDDNQKAGDPEGDQTQESDSEEGEEVKNTSAENFRKLRNIVKETKKVLAEREAKLKETEEKLNAYETGEVLPEALQAKQRVS